MFCKECGVENQDDSLRCKSCNAYLKSSNSPLDGTDRTKIISFFAFLILPFAWFGISVIIILIVLFGLYIMNKDRSFIPIMNAKKWIKVYLIALALIIVAMDITTYYYDAKPIWVGVAGLILPLLAVILLMWIFDILFFKPLEEHQDWIVQHGIFADEPNEKSLLDVAKEKIQSFQKQPSCSVADELLKWKSLLDQGVITDEEFNERKEKLLK